MGPFRFLLYLPAIIFFLLPVLNILYQSTKIKGATKASEEKRRRAAEIKQAGNEKVPAEKKRPGRPRKNPPVELPENILTIQNAEVSAPVRAGNAPDRKPEKAAPLPTSCTLEQFAAWIE